MRFNFYAMSFIQDCEKQLQMFEWTNGRKPIDGNEFAEWCEFMEKNSQTENSRRDPGGYFYTDKDGQQSHTWDFEESIGE